MTAGIEVGPDGRPRCWWASGDELYRDYHDSEWGRPVADDRRLFEKLCLEGFMAGLSWLTILRKRENFRRAFAQFEPDRIARFTSADEDRLMTDAGIVRNRAKISAVVTNSRRYQDLVKVTGSFAGHVWSFAPSPRIAPLSHEELMRVKFSPDAAGLSKDLRKRGWHFVGPTTVYSFMQAMGLVNDHVGGCFVAEEVAAMQRVFARP